MSFVFYEGTAFYALENELLRKTLKITYAVRSK